MKHIKWISFAFVAGFLATLVFHQGLVALFYQLSILPVQPFNMAATKPFGIPSVISISFFGGLWGILIWKFVSIGSTLKQIIKAIVFGAIGPTAVAFFIVLPLKGLTPPLALIPIGFALNGAWGLGVWVFMRLASFK